MSARDLKFAKVNTLELDAMDRNNRISRGPYRLNNAGQFVHGSDGAGMTREEREIAVFCLNNWKLISAAIRLVN